MKYLFIFASIFIYYSCSTSKEIPASVENIDGSWAMISFSAFSPNIPTISDGDIIWSIDTNKSFVSISKRDPQKHQFIGPAEGDHFARNNNAILRVGDQMYLYSIKDNVLTLDSNVDPMLSNDLPVMQFKRLK